MNRGSYDQLNTGENAAKKCTPGSLELLEVVWKAVHMRGGVVDLSDFLDLGPFVACRSSALNIHFFFISAQTH